MTEQWDQSLEAHRARQRRVVFDATVALVAENGMSAVSMAEVARRAGIGRATLYKYFPSVEHILAAMTLEEIRRERAALDDALDGIDDPLQRIDLSVRFLLDYFGSARHRDAAAVVSPHQFSPDVGREVADAFLDLHAMIADMVRDAVARGELRSDTPPDFQAEALQQLLAAGRQAIVSDRMDVDAAASALMTMFLDGARAR